MKTINDWFFRTDGTVMGMCDETKICTSRVVEFDGDVTIRTYSGSKYVLGTKNSFCEVEHCQRYFGCDTPEEAIKAYLERFDDGSC